MNEIPDTTTHFKTHSQFAPTQTHRYKPLGEYQIKTNIKQLALACETNRPTNKKVTAPPPPPSTAMQIAAEEIINENSMNIKMFPCQVENRVLSATAHSQISSIPSKSVWRTTTFFFKTCSATLCCSDDELHAWWHARNVNFRLCNKTLILSYCNETSLYGCTGVVMTLHAYLF